MAADQKSVENSIANHIVEIARHFNLMASEANASELSWCEVLECFGMINPLLSKDGEQLFGVFLIAVKIALDNPLFEEFERKQFERYMGSASS